MSDAWLILALASGLRGRTLETLLDRFGDAEHIVEASPSELSAAGLSRPTLRQITDPDGRKLDLCHSWIAMDGHHAITLVDERYPQLLREITDPPTVLFARGKIDALSLPQFAIVGSRNATPGGRETARRFARYLAENGFCITSGLALGIDGAAHEGALDVGGSTVAVLGTGPDEIYPAAHEGLADRIADNGALITEFPPGSPVRRSHFPQRNRLISGMTVGTLVAEAGRKSGALITARFAAEQGREVFAIPGSIHNPMARGCHQLIRSGAKLVETGSDIIEELPGLLAGLAESVKQNMAPNPPLADPGIDPDYQRLLTFMGWDPVAVDTLIERSGLTAEEVSSMLLILELEGHIDSLTGGRYLQRGKGRSK